MPQANYISHVQYRTYDRERAFSFLIDVLGFYPQRRGRILYAGKDNTWIELGTERPELEEELVDSDRYVFGVSVDNLEEAIAECETHGARVTRPFTQAVTSFWGRQAVIAVPGGQPIALREYRAPDGPHFTEWTPEPGT